MGATLFSSFNTRSSKKSVRIKLPREELKACPKVVSAATGASTPHSFPFGLGLSLPLLFLIVPYQK